MRKTISTLCRLGSTSLAIAAFLAATSATQAQQVPEFWHYMGAGGELQGIEGLMSEVEKVMPGEITHRVVPGGGNGLRQQVQVSLMGGVPPATYQLSPGIELMQLAKSGRLQPLDDVFAAINGNEIFPAGVVNAVTYDGHVYAIPFSLGILGNAFYNKKIFDELGLSEPTTWEEWDAAADKIEAAGYTVMTSASGPAWTFYQFYAPLITVLGTEGYLELASGRMPYTDPRIGEAIDLYTKSIVDNFDDKWTGANWSEGVDRLMRGEVAVYVVGDWASGYMKQRGWTPGEDYDFFPLPGLDGVTIFQGDAAAVIAGDQASLGARFAEVTGSAAAQAAFNTSKGSLAPNETVSPDIYDVLTRAEYDKMVAEGGEMVPNLYVLTPLSIRPDLGTAFERYAATKDRAALDAELARLDPVREQLLAAGEFADW